ncbi:DUF4840 domain-containing protein [Paraglaciecola sp. L3A3]|uniref:DUF4840 domain-containing protein n=1 Tax=Paraglaciecola sp. L3A3 TaxID=2686358 RepID=UPI001E53E796|nr:DUF4840 domain-containing protein [Paraglaciecola sp. L3A3]
MLKTTLLILTLTGVSTQAFGQNDCHQDSYLQAKYQIDIKRKDQASKTTELILWRKKNTVAHQYPSTLVSEMWQLVPNSKKQLIKPTRFFEAHKRAIEYQPGETVHGKKETDWSYRLQLISDTFLNTMTLTNQLDKGCDSIDYLSKKDTDSEITIEWLPERKLVKSFTLVSDHHQEKWQLVKLTEQAKIIQSYFTALDKYQTTDFADIGDDHTDPFLTNMVTLGFIEPGASGFYDDKGKALSGGHHH